MREQCGTAWEGAGGTFRRNGLTVRSMSTPKTIYSQSEARRLRAQPCKHCGKTSRVEKNVQDDLGGKADPDVSVRWCCPDPLCVGHDGFWIEEQ